MSQFEGKDSKRHFTVVMGDKEHGLYVSSTPSSAAKKAVTKLCAANKKKKVEFYIREITQGSKKKTYGPYLGYIEKLKEPIELKGRIIKHKSVVKLQKKEGGELFGFTKKISEFNKNKEGKLTSEAVNKMLENFKADSMPLGLEQKFKLKTRIGKPDSFYFGEILKFNREPYFRYNLFNIKENSYKKYPRTFDEKNLSYRILIFDYNEYLKILQVLEQTNSQNTLYSYELTNIHRANDQKNFYIWQFNLEFLIQFINLMSNYMQVQKKIPLNFETIYPIIEKIAFNRKIIVFDESKINSRDNNPYIKDDDYTAGKVIREVNDYLKQYIRKLDTAISELEKERMGQRIQIRKQIEMQEEYDARQRQKGYQVPHRTYRQLYENLQSESNHSQPQSIPPQPKSIPSQLQPQSIPPQPKSIPSQLQPQSIPSQSYSNPNKPQNTSQPKLHKCEPGYQLTTVGCQRIIPQNTSLFGRVTNTLNPVRALETAQQFSLGALSKGVDLVQNTGKAAQHVLSSGFDSITGFFK